MKTSFLRETYTVLDDLTVTIDVTHNPYQFKLDQLFKMATRINKKRSFLFVSQVLGKHIGVDPSIPLLTGHLLAMRYMEVVHGQENPRAKAIAKAIQTKENIAELAEEMQNEPLQLREKTTFIGFAETATALGHAVFSSFKEDATYIHTTREQMIDRDSVINFEEEHSHATSHRVYARNASFFAGSGEVVLVDDEMTTGKTAINIIRTMKAKFPEKKVFTVVVILDWRTEAQRMAYRELEAALGITIHVVSLVEGMVSVAGEPKLLAPEKNVSPIFTPEIQMISAYEWLTPDMFEAFSSIEENGGENQSSYLKATGRFGLTAEQDKTYLKTFQTLVQQLKEQRRGKKTLVIGTGEFMYVPMKIASYMGEQVYFQATTRSPIYETTRKGYTIQQKFTFTSPENAGLVNHLYNIDEQQYDEIFIFVERMSAKDEITSLIDALGKTKIPFITVVVMAKTEQGDEK